MYWGSGDWNWAAWLMMTASMVLFWGLVAWIVITIVRRPSENHRIQASGARQPGSR